MRQYIVDAFTDRPFSGNPAAVCPLSAWLPEATLQKIALENNLSETAFFVKEGPGYRLRWFTPAAEEELCGHATLATAFVILTILDPEAPGVRFETRSGPLTVVRRGGHLICELLGDGRMALRGKATLVAVSEIVADL